jgi:hypothetical protein
MYQKEKSHVIMNHYLARIVRNYSYANLGVSIIHVFVKYCRRRLASGCACLLHPSFLLIPIYIVKTTRAFLLAIMRCKLGGNYRSIPSKVQLRREGKTDYVSPHHRQQYEVKTTNYS